MKKVLSVLLAAVMLACLIPCFSVPVAADSLYIRKIVSVVYDDSGSMGSRLNSNSKWASANYAMQAFCGMLNSEDELYITYMSNANNNPTYLGAQIDLSAGGIQNSVDAIRDRTFSGGTPFAAVQSAYNRLLKTQDSNPNTQYWLVVITDGGFETSKNYFEFDSKGDPVYRQNSNEVATKSASKLQDSAELTSIFEGYADSLMPNGTYPQITFLGINSDPSKPIPMPNKNESKGIYTYSASGADAIVDTMSQMADRVSGRTRVDRSAITVVDDHTVKVSSTIPLLNIAVFSQKSTAKVKEARGEGDTIPISRQASLSFLDSPKLKGAASLLGDSQNVIGAGEYTITFEDAVDVNNLDILFEPALEMRMTVSVNGTVLSDYRELRNTMEKDKVSISCKIYEMGTDKEVDPSLLPPNTKFEILVNENGSEAVRQEGQDMKLAEYILKNVDTEIIAKVTIDGFKPIEYYERFTPANYAPKVVYTVTAGFNNDVKSVKMDDLATNKDMAVQFTVYADGVPMTDPAAVQALGPVITASPAGNTGNVSYSADGKIVYTPTGGALPSADADSFDVQVTCTLDKNITVTEVSAAATYTVLVALYEIFPMNVIGNITCTRFYGNTVGASYYLTKDGTRLTKAEVEAGASGVLNEAFAHLNVDVEVAADGTITIIPNDPTEHKLTFGSWWSNWWWYFGLPKEDVVVTLSHSYGTASTVIDVVNPPASYLVWNVWTPLILEILLTLFLIWWIYCIICQPMFVEGTAFYIGKLKFVDSGIDRIHRISLFKDYPLARYNRFWWRLVPWIYYPKVKLSGPVTISPTCSDVVLCHFRAWRRTGIEPYAGGGFAPKCEHPADIKEHISKMRSRNFDILEVEVDAKSIKDDQMLDGCNSKKYWIVPPAGKRGTKLVNGIDTIDEGYIVAYAYIPRRK